VSHAREWGHIHLDEILAILPKLKNERIVLMHTSVRYAPGYLREILAKRLPESEKDRVVLFPRSP
jgi:ribonuclease Z